MSSKRRKYSRPNGHVEKIYPVSISETDSSGKSLLIKAKMVAFKLNAGEAAKLAVALMNAVGMISKDYKSIDLTIRIKDNHFTVTVF